jgi:hypothetical protein
MKVDGCDVDPRELAPCGAGTLGRFSSPTVSGSVGFSGLVTV